MPQSGCVVQREAAICAVNSSNSDVLMPSTIRAKTCCERISGFTVRPREALRILCRTLSKETFSRSPLRFRTCILKGMRGFMGPGCTAGMGEASGQFYAVPSNTKVKNASA